MENAWLTGLEDLVQLPINPQVIQHLFSTINFEKITKAIIVLIVTYFGLYASARFVNWSSEGVPRQFRIGIKQSFPIWRAFVLLLALTTILNLFIQISANNILSLIAILGVAVGFAFKDYASSVIAGVVALFEAPYRVGDRIQIGDYYGEVVNYGLRGIRLQSPDDELITIPHNRLWTDAIINLNQGHLEAQIVTHFYLDHQVNPESVIRLLYEVAYTSKYSQVKLPVSVAIKEELWGTNFQLQSYVMDVREEEEYKTDLIKRAKKAFTEAGFSYPFLPKSSMVSQ